MYAQYNGIFDSYLKQIRGDLGDFETKFNNEMNKYEASK